MVFQGVEFVCSGNLCRSPFAEGVARALGVQAASSGLWALDGARCPSEAVEAATHFAVDLSQHRARRTSPDELAGVARVAVMDLTHLRAVRKLLPDAGRPEVVLLGSFAAGAGVEIPDPYGHPVARYLSIYGVIDMAVRALLGGEGAVPRGSRLGGGETPDGQDP